MNHTYLLGVDLGTTAIKAALVTTEGEVVCSDTQEYTSITPCENAVEQRVDVYWNAFRTALRDLLGRTGVSPCAIVALSLSVQGETLVFLDKDMQPVHNAIVWLDTRPQLEADQINGWFSPQELLQVTGQGPITSLYPAAKILWMSRTHPEEFERVARVLLLEDYFFLRLGGVCCGEGSLWCTSYMWDINTGDWWQPMLNRLGIRREQLPQILPTGTCLGKIRAGVAQELGLDPNTLLVMGALDQACSAIGAGSVAPGIFTESTGAALVVSTLSDHIVLVPGGELPCFYGALPGSFMLHAGGKGGIAYRWLRDTLCQEEVRQAAQAHCSAYTLMDQEAMGVPPGSSGLTVLPFFGGAGAPDTDPYAKCMIYGLGLQHTKSHLIRGFMESIAVNIFRMVDYAEKATGLPVTQIRTTGGGSKSPLWSQIKADVLGRPVITMQHTEDAACLGAAMIAGVGAGLWSSVPEIAPRWIRPDQTFEPDPATREAYDELVGRYDRLLDCIKGKTRSL